jgi:nicotinate-nucleotide adenylyltransferase
MGAGPRIAFFGGSFDPPHNGHLAVARAAQAALKLDRVLFAPVAAQPLKPHGAGAGFEHRLAMTRLAIVGHAGLELSLADAPGPSGSTPSPNYTIDTLDRLRHDLPPGSALFCLMGADSFLSLRHWHRGAEIPFASPLIVAARPGQSLADLGAALPSGLSLSGGIPAESESEPLAIRTYVLRNASGAVAPFYVLPSLHMDISASQIRSEIRLGAHSIPSLLPGSVARYIAEHALYR